MSIKDYGAVGESKDITRDLQKEIEDWAISRNSQCEVVKVCNEARDMIWNSASVCHILETGLDIMGNIRSVAHSSFDEGDFRGKGYMSEPADKFSYENSITRMSIKMIFISDIYTFWEGVNEFPKPKYWDKDPYLSVIKCIRNACFHSDGDIGPRQHDGYDKDKYNEDIKTLNKNIKSVFSGCPSSLKEWKTTNYGKEFDDKYIENSNRIPLHEVFRYHRFIDNILDAQQCFLWSLSDFRRFSKTKMGRERRLLKEVCNDDEKVR